MGLKIRLLPPFFDVLSELLKFNVSENLNLISLFWWKFGRLKVPQNS